MFTMLDRATICCFFLVIIALLFGCAMVVSVLERRSSWIGPRRRFRDTAGADPFFHPFGEMPEVPNWRRLISEDDFRSAQALPRIAAGEPSLDVPSGLLAGRTWRAI